MALSDYKFILGIHKFGTLSKVYSALISRGNPRCLRRLLTTREYYRVIVGFRDTLCFRYIL